jgi:hypothetical protein
MSSGDGEFVVSVVGRASVYSVLTILMQASGHINAHCAHPVQSSGLISDAGWKPLALVCLALAMARRGQAAMHSPQSLHMFSSTMMVTRAFVLDTMPGSPRGRSLLPT